MYGVFLAQPGDAHVAMRERLLDLQLLRIA
jgi:hypothetical protein